MFTVTKLKIETIESTNPIFAMLDPITLLIAIEGDPLSAAFTLTINSGKDVANATTVIPMANFEILNLKDKETEALTIYSPPTTSKKNPVRIDNILILFDNQFQR